MQAEYRTYLGSVRAALWSREQAESVSLPLCVQQGTGPLVFPLLLQQGMTLAQADRQQMKAVCVQTMQQQVRLAYTLKTACEALTNAGIRPVLMKGAGLAAYYAEPNRRAWSDIDLFVGKEQYHAACAVMRQTFPKALKFDEELDHYKHYNLIADGISIEMHRVSMSLAHPRDHYAYDRIERFGMSAQHVRPLRLDGVEVTVPEPTFNALFVCMHSWEHVLSEGACLRQFCDLALLLHQEAKTIDRARLKRWLRRLSMTDVWRLYMTVLVDYLGLRPDEAPLYDRYHGTQAERLINDLLGGRLTSIKEERTAPSNRWRRKVHTMQQRLRNAQRIAPYSNAYARHMRAETILHGATRLFAKDRHWE